MEFVDEPEGTYEVRFSLTLAKDLIDCKRKLQALESANVMCSTIWVNEGVDNYEELKSVPSMLHVFRGKESVGEIVV